MKLYKFEIYFAPFGSLSVNAGHSTSAAILAVAARIKEGLNSHITRIVCNELGIDMKNDGGYFLELVVINNR